MQIVVHGAGIFGLSIAWACAGRGARVSVVDPHGTGAGASGGVVGALAPHVPEAWNTKKALQFESLVMAEAFWAEVAEASGHNPGYSRSGRVQPLADAEAVDRAQARATSAAELWQGRYRWEVRDAAAFGDLVHSPTGHVVFDTLTARAPSEARHSGLGRSAGKTGRRYRHGTGRGRCRHPRHRRRGTAGAERDLPARS